mmetsp:Transcript_26437/g.78512  ORF Transcript_26437/g.78512 Transcript_26437/m.78512 type:complete len:220 (+) Transcript_26437:1157-1816(+)
MAPAALAVAATTTRRWRTRHWQAYRRKLTRSSTAFRPAAASSTARARRLASLAGARTLTRRRYRRLRSCRASPPAPPRSTPRAARAAGVAAATRQARQARVTQRATLLRPATLLRRCGAGRAATERLGVVARRARDHPAGRRAQGPARTTTTRRAVVTSTAAAVVAVGSAPQARQRSRMRRRRAGHLPASADRTCPPPFQFLPPMLPHAETHAETQPEA